MKMSLRKSAHIASLVLFGLGITVCDYPTNTVSAAAADDSTASAGNVDDARIINLPNTEPGSWLTYGQTYIDANDGEEIWDIDTWHPLGLGRFNITGAPRAAAGKIYIGQGSSESGHRRGYVTAYDAETGEVDWRFFLVPGDPSKPFEHPEMEMAAQSFQSSHFASSHESRQWTRGYCVWYWRLQPSRTSGMTKIQVLQEQIPALRVRHTVVAKAM